MSLRAALCAGFGALILILALGNPAVSDAITDEDNRSAWPLVVAGATWDTDTYDGDVGPTAPADGSEDDYRTGLVLRAVVFVLLCGLLGGVAGRARIGSAFIAGWGLTFLASAIGTTVFLETASSESLSITGSENPNVMDTLVSGTIFWGPMPLLFGWIVGFATMVGATLPQAPRNLATAADVPASPPPPYSPGAYAAGAGTAYGASGGGYGAAGAPPPLPGAGGPSGPATGPAISAPPERTARHDAASPPADDAPPSPS